MSQFSLALNAASQSAGLSQTRIAELSGISLSSINKYFRDAAPVGPKVVEKIIRVFPPPHGADLLAAFLRDEIPESLSNLVEILPTALRLNEPAPDPIPGPDVLGGEARELIAFFARRMKDKTIYAMLESTRRALVAQ